jgi:hypothetical protein
MLTIKYAIKQTHEKSIKMAKMNRKFYDVRKKMKRNEKKGKEKLIKLLYCLKMRTKTFAMFR